MPSPAGTPMRSERAIQREIVRLLLARGCVAFPLNRERAGAKRANHIGVKGLPDIGGWMVVRQRSYVCQSDQCSRHDREEPNPFADGRMHYHTHQVARPVYVEVKRPGGKLRPEQAAFLAKARKDGCVAFMATSCEDVAREMGWE